MQYLLDTNILVEFLLDQDKANEVEHLFTKIPPRNCFITTFSLFSIGIILFRHKKHDTFNEVVDDLLHFSGIQLLGLSLKDLFTLSVVSQKFNLDFDDAYQYVAAEKHDLTLVSFDSDFDRTERGRKTPAEILKNL